MKLPSLEQFRPLAVPTGIGIAAAVLGYAVAGALASNEALEIRTAQARARLDQAEARLAQLSSRPTTSAILCQGSPVAAETVLEGRLSEAASRTGVVWRDTQFQVDEGTGYAVLRFRTTAEGPYEVVVQALSGLASTSPTIFAERLDLRAGPQGVRAELEGSQLCLTSAS